MQASGNNYYMLGIGTDGVMTASRHRGGNGANAVASVGTWFTVSATYVVV